MEVYEDKYAGKLKKLCELQQEVAEIHHLFKYTYPVAIVEDGCFVIFDKTSKSGNYRLIKVEPVTMPLPEGVRASFPLESYDSKPAAIVTGDVFDSMEGYVTVLHEFVHCHQSNTCDLELKMGLKLAQESYSRKDYIWEINYPFPYTNSCVVEYMSEYVKSLKKGVLPYVLPSRKQLFTALSQYDIEYMLWQEWKEGFARFIENKINRYLGLSQNFYGLSEPHNRVLFYETGSEFISLLEKEDGRVTHDIEKLFGVMKEKVL